MLRTRTAGRLPAAVVLLAVLPSLGAQDKDITAKGQVKVGVHKHKFEAGKLYQVRIDAEGFSPQVTLRPGYFINPEQLNQGDTFQGFVLPPETKDYRVVVVPNVNDDLDSQPLDYKLTITPIPLAAKPILEEKGRLTDKDPPYNNPNAGNKAPHKAYPIQLKARQYYVITMKTTAKDMDPYLVLEGPGEMVVARDDDGAGNTNARIFVQPRRSGEYRIIATAVSKELGEFTVTVQTTETTEKDK